MGDNAVRGIDGAQGPTPHRGLVTCLKDPSAWDLLGAIYDPEVHDFNLGLTTYSFHPEALSWADAEATCVLQASVVQARRTGSMPGGGPVAVGHLASAATDIDIQMLLHVMSQLPPVFTSPGYGELPDFYGFWVGLRTSSDDLTNALSAPPGAFRTIVLANDTSALRWTDGSAASAGIGASVLQVG